MALELAGGKSFLRKALVKQCASAQAIAYFAGDEPLALAMIDTPRARRAELALAFFAGAPAHMRELVRIAQLTLTAIAETGVLVFARVDPGNRQGQRMARLVGLRPGNFRDPALWIFKAR